MFNLEAIQNFSQGEVGLMVGMAIGVIVILYLLNTILKSFGMDHKGVHYEGAYDDVDTPWYYVLRTLFVTHLVVWMSSVALYLGLTFLTDFTESFRAWAVDTERLVIIISLVIISYAIVKDPDFFFGKK